MHNLPYARGMIRHADTSYGLPAPITEYINPEKYRDGNDLFLHHIASPELDVGPNPKHKYYSHAMDLLRSDARGGMKWRKNLARRRAHNDDHDTMEGSSRFYNNLPQITLPTRGTASRSSPALDDIQAKLSDLRRRMIDTNTAIDEALQSLLSCGRGHDDHVPATYSGEEINPDKVEKEVDADSTADAVADEGVVAEGVSGAKSEVENVGDWQNSEGYEIVGSDEGKKSDQIEICNETSICWG